MKLVVRLAATLFLFVSVAEARVISYAAYTDRASTPALQNRLDRHFVLVEQVSAIGNVPIVSPPPPYGYLPPGQLVMYDSKGLEEPRVIFPQDGTTTAINFAGVREDERQVPAILIETTEN